MLTFKKWKTLNENFGGAIPIGLGQPNSVVGVVGAQFEEAKAKKKMFGDEAPEKEEKDDDEDEDKEVKIVVKGKKDDDDKEEKVEKEPEGEKEPDNDADDKKPAFLMSKKKCGSGCNKSNKKMAKENKEWYGSVIGQLNSDPNAKFWDGFSSLEEDVVIAPQDQNAGLSEPQPGDVGSAPVQRVGGWFGG